MDSLIKKNVFVWEVVGHLCKVIFRQDLDAYKPHSPNIKYYKLHNSPIGDIQAPSINP
jgi:hypothetical protein